MQPPIKIEQPTALASPTDVALALRHPRLISVLRDDDYAISREARK
jgi:hypothetical protein